MSNPLARAKIQLKLATQRTRLLSAKKEAICKKSRRDIASLVEKSKLETARIRVETVINEEIHIELLELLELYCELLTARFGLIELQRDVEPTISEAVYGIIHAAPKTELRELHVLRDMLIAHYGKDIGLAATENRDNCVSERVISKLNAKTPAAELVDLYLYEISKAYGLNWKPDSMIEADKPAGKVPEPLSKPDDSLPHAHPPAADIPLPSPSLVAPEDAPRTVTIKTNLPSDSPAATAAATKKASEDDEYEALRKRFEALKRK